MNRHYVDFHAAHGVVQCGPFPTLDAAYEFAIRVDPSAYKRLVYHDDPATPDEFANIAPDDGEAMSIFCGE
jgi:hypothetical protein